MTNEAAPQLLSHSHCGSVTAAAGCGKTELIVQTVSLLNDRHTLVLTHTNAGVNALRRRLARRRVASKSWTVDTIDGWCKRFVNAFPASSGVKPQNAEDEVDWEGLRAGMLRLIVLPFTQRVIRASYAGVLVDEYQDCTNDQHAIVCALKGLLPTCILGDSMQAIFGFGNNRLVSWSIVEELFPRVLELETPHRWQQKGASSSLGRWLTQARSHLERDEDVNLQGAPVIWERAKRMVTQKREWIDYMTAVIGASSRLVRKAGTGERIVILWKWPRQCHMTAMRTGGLFQCVEPIEARDGRDALKSFANKQGVELVTAVYTFAGKCCTQITKHSTKFNNWCQGRGRPTPADNELVRPLRRLHDGDQTSTVDVLVALRGYSGAREYRRELILAVIHSLQAFDSGDATSALEAFTQNRQATSRSGRSLFRRSVGTPLLVKGLEFEHVILVADGEMSAKELYVALSRGTKSLTIVSAEQRLVPRPGTTQA